MAPTSKLVVLFLVLNLLRFTSVHGNSKSCHCSCPPAPSPGIPTPPPVVAPAPPPAPVVSPTPPPAPVVAPTPPPTVAPMPPPVVAPMPPPVVAPTPPPTVAPTPPPVVAPTPPPAPVVGPKPPPVGPKPPKCPMDMLKFRVCANVLKMIKLNLNVPPNEECCPLINGLAEADLAICLCPALKLNIFGVKLNQNADITLLLNYCGKPGEFMCPI